MDKNTTKQVALDIGIRTPDWCIVSSNSSCSIQPPLVLKPINDGSSYGVYICKSEQDVLAHQEMLFEERKQILVESYIKGRELTVGIIDGKALPIVEIIVPKNLHTYDFEAKYERDDTQYIVEPTLPDNTCIETALSMYAAMGIRDIARVDFLLNDSATWFLELNTMPGFTTHSLVPLAAKHVGISMPELCKTLVEIALHR
jgi:D-alanine-D-alanine ligase